MAIYDIHSAPLLIKHRAYICSKATLFFLLCTLITFVIPLLIAYRSAGFWKKTDWYIEQANVNFKKEIIVLLEMSEEDKFVAWSTFDNFNTLMEGHVFIPLIMFREEDNNRDGIKDVLDFNMSFHLDSQHAVHTVTLLLFFDYQLSKFCRLQMESLAYYRETSVQSGLEARITADLDISQRVPLPHAGVDTTYNTSIINGNSVYARDYDLGDILKSYSDRNVTTVLRNSYSTWKIGRGTNEPFNIRATIRYPEQLILYKTGFWQLIKWAWIQYAAVLVIFIAVFQNIKTFAFQNQIISTIVQQPIKLHNS